MADGAKDKGKDKDSRTPAKASDCSGEKSTTPKVLSFKFCVRSNYSHQKASDPSKVKSSSRQDQQARPPAGEGPAPEEDGGGTGGEQTAALCPDWAPGREGGADTGQQGSGEGPGVGRRVCSGGETRDGLGGDSRTGHDGEGECMVVERPMGGWEEAPELGWMGSTTDTVGQRMSRVVAGVRASRGWVITIRQRGEHRLNRCM